MPVFQPRPSAYDPRRRPPTGRNANPNGAPLNKYQMEQWNKSRREAANDYAYQNRGLQNPVSPAVAREAGPGAYLLTGGQGGRSDLEYDGDNNRPVQPPQFSAYDPNRNRLVQPPQPSRAQAVEYDGDNNVSYYGAQAAPVSPINNDHAVGRPRTAAPDSPGLVPQGIQGLIDGYRALPGANPFRYTDTEGEGSEGRGPVRDRSMMSSGSETYPRNPVAPVAPFVPQGPTSPANNRPLPDTAGGGNFTYSNLSNLAGAPATGTSAMVGTLMPGFAGMASRGMLAGMGRAYTEGQNQSDRNVSRAFNGGNPVNQGPWDDRRREQKLTEGFIEGIAESSTDAARKAEAIRNGVPSATGGSFSFENATSSNAANGYNGFVPAANDPNRMTPDDKLAMAQRAASGGGPSQGTAFSGRSPVDDLSGVPGGYRVPQNYGTAPEYRIANPAPEVQYGQNARGNTTSFLPPSSDPVLARQNANLKRPGYIPLTPERRAEKAAEKEAETQRRADVKFKHLVGRGMNPLSPKARGMFPEQVARMKQGLGSRDNPVSPMTAGSPKTSTSVDQARAIATATVLGVPATATSPGAAATPFGAALAARGYDPGSDDSMGIPNLHVFEMTREGTALVPSDARDLQRIAKHVQEQHKGKPPGMGRDANPFYGIATGPYSDNEDYQRSVADSYQELADMPNDASDSDLQGWADRFQSELKRALRFP